MKASLRFLAAISLSLAFNTAWSQPVKFTQVVLQATPIEKLAVSQPSVNSGMSVRFDVQLVGAGAVAPTGSIAFTLTPSDGSHPLTGLADVASGAASWSSVPPIGTYTISAAYSGDSNYLRQTASGNGTVLAPDSGSGTVLAPDFAFTASAMSIKQGQTLTSNIAVTPINGFAGTVRFTCSAPTSLGCSFPSESQTVSLNGHGAGGPSPQLTITAYPGQFTAISALFMVGFAFNSRRKRKFGAGVVTACLGLLLLTGCGTTGTQSGWKPITPKGTYHVTLTGVSGAIQHSKQVNITVE
nr:Ig-like domain-containing protein [Edaphobacter modestus]